jgi:hypothetical protein
MTRKDRAKLVATHAALTTLIAELHKTPDGRRAVRKAWEIARESLGDIADGKAEHDVAAEDRLEQIDLTFGCSENVQPPKWKLRPPSP